MISYYDATSSITSITLKFKSKATGSASFSAKCTVASASEASDASVTTIVISGNPSKTVTIKEKIEQQETITKQTETKKITTNKKETAKKETKQEEVKKSNNANLSSLEVKDFSLTPEFDKDTTKYYLSVNQDIDLLEVNAEVEDSKAKIEILGNENIDFGISSISVKVTAEDGTNKEYSIKVNKQDTALGLSSLIISSESQIFELSPDFNRNTLSYALTTENVSKLDIDALANYEDAIIEITGNSGLKNGKNTITINVKKDDEIKTYLITVNNIKPSLFDKGIAIWKNFWVVFIVTICSLVQSGIAINYVIKYYKKEKN